MGGTGKIVEALARLMSEIEIKVSLNTTIEKILVNNSHITGIIDNYGKTR